MSAYAHILGHDATIAAIETARAADRLPHGVIFAGPVGVGKFTTAKVLASIFLCDGAAQCEHLVETGTHPDFHVVTRELTRYHDKTGKSKAIQLGIEVVRNEIVEPASRKSVDGSGKVFIIEEAHKMTAAAQNGLLKTLEEPAGRALLVLLTDAPEALLPTIRSRCQTFRFGTLPQAQAAAILEKQGLSAKDAATAAKLSEGAPGQALRWYEDGVVARAVRLFALLKGDTSELPKFLTDAGSAYADAAIKRDPLGSKDAANREGVATYLALAGRYYREQLVENPEHAADAIDALARAETYLNGNVNTSLVYQQLAASL